MSIFFSISNSVLKHFLRQKLINVCNLYIMNSDHSNINFKVNFQKCFLKTLLFLFVFYKMIWLHLTSITPSLHNLFSSHVSVAQSANGTDDSLLRGGFHSSPPPSSLMAQPSSIPMLSTCFNKLFSLLQVHHVQVWIWLEFTNALSLFP